MVKAQAKESGHCTFEKDEYGKEILVKDGNLQVMMEWEKPYMHACIDALEPTGDVLEIGFGLGYSADRIQTFSPKTHTIIECDAEVLKKAKGWAKAHPGAKIVEGYWQDNLDSLGNFDTIFFDDYTPLSLEEASRLAQDSEKMQELSEEVSSLRDALAENLERFRGVKFSDGDLLAFGKSLLEREDTSQESVLSFLDTLVSWGNITEAQKKKFIKEYGSLLKGRKVTKRETQLAQELKQLPGDRFIQFAEACLNKHMKPGARLSAYMGSPESKKGNPEFQKKILTRKDVKYTEKTLPVNVPPNCRYFRGDKALVVVIEKR